MRCVECNREVTERTYLDSEQQVMCRECWMWAYGLCDCNCAQPCPLGKRGMETSCRWSEVASHLGTASLQQTRVALDAWQRIEIQKLYEPWPKVKSLGWIHKKQEAPSGVYENFVVYATGTRIK